jgi:hypothetical protein
MLLMLLCSIPFYDSILAAVTVSAFIRPLLDSKDCGVLVVTHIELLLGCAVPMWVGWGVGRYDLALLGMLGTGIGDAFASVLGSRCAQHCSTSNILND